MENPKLRSNAPPAPAEESKAGVLKSLYLPIRVVFEDESGNINQEIARTSYISANKATVPMHRELMLGMVVRVAAPLPPSWRKHSFTDTVYVTPAVVASIRHEGDLYHTTVNFLSDKEAMRRRREYDEKIRAARANVKTERPNRRVDTRLQIPVELNFAVLDDQGKVVSSEVTVTENISKGGARLMTSQEVRSGDIVRVKGIRETFETRAVVKNAYVGPDGIRRVHIQFMDTEWRI